MPLVPIDGFNVEGKRIERILRYSQPHGQKELHGGFGVAGHVLYMWLALMASGFSQLYGHLP